MRSWKLSENNYGDVKNRRYEVAVLPLGVAVEVDAIVAVRP